MSIHWGHTWRINYYLWVTKKLIPNLALFYPDNVQSKSALTWPHINFII